MNRKLVDAISRHFHKRLQAKTSWGRNDLWLEYQAAINDALLELMDKC
ncbi:MAG: hypothetical protein WC322_06205 [Candidatus Paceibacterota bacterium]|jgi:hypothetical protein